LRIRDDNADVEPVVRIRHGMDSPLVLSRMLGPQLRPGMRGVSDILDRVDATRRIGSAEVEGPEVDRVIGETINTVKRDPD